MYAGSVLKAMLGETVTGVIPTELIPVDRILQRWKVANGSGLPSVQWDDTPRAQPPALDDDTCMLVDEIVRKCPPITRKVVVNWYCKPLPTIEIAKQMRMSPRSLEKHWLMALNFLKLKFECTNNLTLLRLLRVHV